MSLTPEEATNEVYREMRDLLPSALTEVTPLSGSAFNSFIQALASNEGQLRSDLDDFHGNINVLTASASGIAAWEELVNLPMRPDMNLTSRRARVFARVAGTPATITTMKSIIRSYVGSDDFSIYEYWTENNPASAFRYKVVIQRPPSTPYDEESLQADLLRIQPVHCGDYVEIEDAWNAMNEVFRLDETVNIGRNGISETFYFSENIIAIVQNFFVVGTSVVDGSDVVV